MSDATTAMFSTLLSVPGMNEQVKVEAKISRKLVLMLGEVIARGLENGGVVPDAILRASEAEIREFRAQMLEKAGMTELDGNIRSLRVK
ncbi:MAG: hypothetical protein P0Y53_01445 [Candidatus Pseudobacter hemicellulosilyticus]|uniref:Uncharacterized protein n=1 Tax=Candidatus Pseudobacter hemicellulosilyticus TaxID=3121375 RepID=A0AAJ5WV15_9BACT|nr:MAG: hypothetical protein P0Y53_01445 [Pseudobacter sp.]